ncbi:hypothetical protein [Pedobacter sp.]|uniref:hypothetical protein n=1 Tax=Pedobacter sp. TaxID=1411316 RepID=UPI003D7FD731
MSAINTIPEYKDFKEFYLNAVVPLKEQNPTFRRLDGKLVGSTRNVTAYFWYQNKKWRVDADTFIDRLKIAFEEFEKSDEPFKIKHTRDHQGESLLIKGQPIRNKKFNVYRVS